MGFFRRWLQNDVENMIEEAEEREKSNGDCIRKLKKKVD